MSDQLAPKKELPRVKRVPNPNGRPKGVPNKVTQTFRETINRLLEDNRHNIAKWIQQIAEGTPDVLNAEGKVIRAGRPPDPGQAAQRLANLAEFAAPRLSRQETVGDGGGPLTVVIRKESDK